MVFVLIALSALGVASAQILGLREGDECKPLGGGRGLCKALRECRNPGDFKKDHPPICTFKDKEPIICCPNTLVTRTKVGHKAEQYCQYVIDLNLPCTVPRSVRSASSSTDQDTTPRYDGTTSTTEGVLRKPPMKHFVVGGTAVKPRLHKHMALIGYGAQNEIKWSCGGSLITARYVLSAAHCVNPYSQGPARWARLGDLDISTNQEDAKPVDKRIVERITHPDYVDSQVYHDIAIFKLDSNVVFNAWVMPVCLQTKREIQEVQATVTGWGRVEFAAGTSEKLLEADLLVYNDTECKRLMFSATDSKFPRGYQPDGMFCAGVPDGSKDACSGDSGGPLVIRKTGNCIKTQIGITSYGNQCGLPDSPGVYTRVSNYISWIEDIVFSDGLIL